MQNDKIYFDIIANVKSKQDLDKLLAEIDFLEKAIYKTDTAALSTSRLYGYIKDIPQSQQDNFLRELRAKLSDLPTTKVKVPFTPSDALMDKIHEAVGGGLIEIQIDSSIVGGIVIEKNGKYIDLSITRQVSRK